MSPEIFGEISWTYAAVTSELRGKWASNKRSRDVNVIRWEQLKHLLQSGKHKVHHVTSSYQENWGFLVESAGKFTANIK